MRLLQILTSETKRPTPMHLHKTTKMPTELKKVFSTPKEYKSSEKHVFRSPSLAYLVQLKDSKLNTRESLRLTNRSESWRRLSTELAHTL